MDETKLDTLITSIHDLGTQLQNTENNGQKIAVLGVQIGKLDKDIEEIKDTIKEYLAKTSENVIKLRRSVDLQKSNMLSIEKDVIELQTNVTALQLKFAGTQEKKGYDSEIKDFRTFRKSLSWFAYLFANPIIGILVGIGLVALLISDTRSFLTSALLAILGK